MQGIYQASDTLEKKELMDLVFDSNLYYQNGSYRTPEMMRIFEGKQHKMKELDLLISDKKKGKSFDSPFRCTCRDSNPKPSHP